MDWIYNNDFMMTKELFLLFIILSFRLDERAIGFTDMILSLSKIKKEEIMLEWEQGSYIQA